MKIENSLLLALLLTGLGAFAAAQPPTPLAVMTFNVRYDNPGDARNGWSHRREQLPPIMKTADLVGIQEALHHQIQYLDRALADYQRVGVGRDNGKTRGEYVAIYLRRDRFKILDSGTFWFSPTPEKPSTGWGTNIPRTCAWARLHDTRNDQQLTVYNVHWDHRATKSRLESAKLLRRRIAADNPAQAIVMGDFNTTLDSPALQHLAPTDGGLQDTWSVAKTTNTDGGTFHAFTGIPKTGRIDLVLTTGFTVTTATIHRNHQNNRYPSDHFPVSATILPKPVVPGSPSLGPHPQE